MKTGRTMVSLLLLAGLWLSAAAQAAGPEREPFKGKLFPPNVILEHQDELGLSREQFAQIRAAVVEVQANVAEHEWDMREAYLRIMEALDDKPIDEDAVIAMANDALLAENAIKKKQMAMLIRLRNLLTDEQIDYLRARTAE